ncbi:hypothetical protein Hanom_Chr12g01074121 [Helianthus anomalus]
MGLAMPQSRFQIHVDGFLLKSTRRCNFTDLKGWGMPLTVVGATVEEHHFNSCHREDIRPLEDCFFCSTL